ncbi:hypothetical protein [Caulobacter sp. Root487D2Y]|nr:hypothetical protein [Caulobacter sp. Root487D2Y]
MPAILRSLGGFAAFGWAAFGWAAIGLALAAAPALAVTPRRRPSR